MERACGAKKKNSDDIAYKNIVMIFLKDEIIHFVKVKAWLVQLHVKK